MYFIADLLNLLREEVFGNSKTLSIYPYIDYLKLIKQKITAIKKAIGSFDYKYGNISKYIWTERGCWQGDHISPYLFILCAEILGILILKSNLIRRFIFSQSYRQNCLKLILNKTDQVCKHW